MATKFETGILEGDAVRQARGDMFDRLTVGPAAGTLDEVELVAPVESSAS